jgi:hypothetical protein
VLAWTQWNKETSFHGWVESTTGLWARKQARLVRHTNTLYCLFISYFRLPFRFFVFPLFSVVINSLYVDAFHFVLNIGIIYSIPSFSLFSPFPVILEFQRTQSLSHLIRRVETDRLLVPRCQLYTHQICLVLWPDTQIAYGTWRRLLNSVIFFTVGLLQKIYHFECDRRLCDWLLRAVPTARVESIHCAVTKTICARPRWEGCTQKRRMYCVHNGFS